MDQHGGSIHREIVIAEAEQPHQHRPLRLGSLSYAGRGVGCTYVCLGKAGAVRGQMIKPTFVTRGKPHRVTDRTRSCNGNDY